MRKDTLQTALIIICISIFIFDFAFYNNQGYIDSLHKSLKIVISLALAVILPLTIFKNFIWRILSCILILIPLTIFGMWWTNYPDAGPLVFIFYYAPLVFILVILGHFTLKLLENSPKPKKWAIVLIIVFIGLFILAVLNISSGLADLERAELSERQKECNSYMSSEELSSNCARLKELNLEEYYFKLACGENYPDKEFWRVFAFDDNGTGHEVSRPRNNNLEEKEQCFSKVRERFSFFRPRDYIYSY